jgi:serpin B
MTLKKKNDWRRTMKKRNEIKFVLVFLVWALVTSGLVGCVTPAPVGMAPEPDTIQSAGLIQSGRARLPAQPLDEAQVAELVAGNTAFALDLYHVLYSGEENLFYSPHSISIALAMTYAGARAETERQMAAALHYRLPQEQLHAAFNTLDRLLASRGQETTEEAFRLYITNALWGGQEESFLESFLATLAENYGAGMRIVDFAQSAEARRIINQWVSEQTERKIPELLPPNSIDSETALVLTNAVYFKAAWLHAFAKEMTQNGSFDLLDGGQVTVPMMSQVAELGYAEGSGVQAIELPYADEELSMVILLPEAGAFEQFAQGLDADSLAAIMNDLEPTSMHLTMPQFNFDTEFQLKDALMELGMVDAFGEADFSGIDGTTELFVTEVYHQATVAVDEAGTEATAATAVVMARKGLAAQQEVRIERPFLFLIRDIETGSILFLGHVLNPVY